MVDSQHTISLINGKMEFNNLLNKEKMIIGDLVK